MDEQRFDQLSRRFARLRTRRQALKAIAGAVVVTVTGVKAADAQQCAAHYSPCGGDADCCAGAVCEYGLCMPGCRIEGTVYSPWSMPPGEVCRQCTPELSTTSWTPANEGMSCWSGDPTAGVTTCQNGVCTGSGPAECRPQTACHTAALNPQTGQCDQGFAETGTPCGNPAMCHGDVYTPADACDGNGFCIGGGARAVACGGGPTCVTGVCDPAGAGCVQTLNPGACLIDDTCYADGERNPDNGCQVCDPATPNGWTDCSGEEVCFQGACASTCASSADCAGSAVCYGGLCVSRIDGVLETDDPHENGCHPYPAPYDAYTIEHGGGPLAIGLIQFAPLVSGFMSLFETALDPGLGCANRRATTWGSDSRCLEMSELAAGTYVVVIQSFATDLSLDYGPYTVTFGSGPGCF